MTGAPWDHPDADPLGDMREAAASAKRQYVEGLAVDPRDAFDRWRAARYPHLYEWMTSDTDDSPPWEGLNVEERELLGRTLAELAVVETPTPGGEQ